MADLSLLLGQSRYPRGQIMLPGVSLSRSIGSENIRISESVSLFPPGVTLTDIDGGNTFYADHNLTYASNAGWDDADFFPIAPFLEKYRDQTDANRWAQLGWNTAIDIQGDADLLVMHNNGTFLFVQADEWLNDGGNNIYQATLRSTVVGINGHDEPSTLAQAFDAIAAFPNAQQDNRLWFEGFTVNQLIGFDIQGVPMSTIMTTDTATPNATTRELDICGLDEYFFNGSYASVWRSFAGDVFNLGRSMTADEMRRGCRYSDIVRFMRGRSGQYGVAGNSPTGHGAFKSASGVGTPLGVDVETGQSYSENPTTAEAVRSAEINAAVWGNLIGGARMVKYFTLGEGDGTGLIGGDKWKTPYNGDTVSNFDQVVATNALVTSLAEILNSPFAFGYATVSPPPVRVTSSNPDSGFEIMVKYYNRGSSANNKFYIFAIPRYGNRTHNNSGVDTGAETWPKTATFTIANTGSTQVTVINESRTISVTDGTTFLDSFAASTTVHIYRVD